jgi:hypothetical protein
LISFFRSSLRTLTSRPFSESFLRNSFIFLSLFISGTLVSSKGVNSVNRDAVKKISDDYIEDFSLYLRLIRRCSILGSMAKKIVFKIIIYFSSYFLSGLPVYARSPVPSCAKKPLTTSESELLKERMRSHKVYTSILLLNSAETKIFVTRCNQTSGRIATSYTLFKNILGKKCSINSMEFPFSIKGKDVEFKENYLIKNQGIPENLNSSSLRLVLEKIVKSSSVHSFFPTSNFCQIEYSGSGDQYHWEVQLRNENKKYCFIRSSLDGKEVKEIKRKYAISSQCS